MAGWEQMEQGLFGQGIRTAGLSGTGLAVPGQPDATFGVHRILRLSERLGCVSCLLRHYGGRRVREANGDASKERGRWFFTDGDYAKFTPEELAPPKKVEPLDEIDLEIPALGRVFHQNRKPN